MVKISAGIAYKQNRLTGLASALNAQFGFWWKSALKMHRTNIFFSDKSCYQSQYATFVAIFFFFVSLHGFGLCPDCTIRFFGEKGLKNALNKKIFQTKAVRNQKLQHLCYVAFFDILRHFGVIAANGTH